MRNEKFSPEKLNRFLLTLVFSFSLTISATGQSLLFKVSENGLKNPVYIFGTVHAFPASHFFIDDIVLEKLQKSEKLVLEVDMSNPAIFFEMAQYMIMSGQTLADLLSKEEYEKASQFFSDSLQMPLALLDNIKPLLISGMMIPYLIGEEMNSYEDFLVKQAQSFDIAIDGLETVKEQMGYIDRIPLEDQAKMLIEQLNNTQESRTMMKEMIETYKARDAHLGYEFVTHHAAEFKEFGEYLLAERNQNWIPRIIELAAEKTTFIAVGCGHLGGKRGVLNLLKQAGYAVEEVK